MIDFKKAINENKYLKEEIKKLEIELYGYKKRAGKVCKICGKLKPLGEFNKCKDSMDDYDNMCRICRHKQYNKK